MFCFVEQERYVVFKNQINNFLPPVNNSSIINKPRLLVTTGTMAGTAQCGRIH
jgi:hypothetical protein